MFLLFVIITIILIIWFVYNCTAVLYYMVSVCLTTWLPITCSFMEEALMLLCDSRVATVVGGCTNALHMHTCSYCLVTRKAAWALFIELYGIDRSLNWISNFCTVRVISLFKLHTKEILKACKVIIQLAVAAYSYGNWIASYLF